MLQPQQVEELITLILSMDRASLMRQLDQYPSSFPLDFTAEFLNNIPIERLRHIFLAVCLHCQRLPEMQDTATDVRSPSAA